MCTPGLIQSHYNITIYNCITNEAQVSKQFMVVHFTVGQALSLVVSVTHERLLTLGTDKVLHMPVFAQCRHHALLDGTTTRTTNWDAHFVMTPKTIQLIHFISSVAGSTLDLPGICSELITTSSTVEVVRVEGVPTPPQGVTINDSMATVTHVLPLGLGLDPGIALMAESTAGIADEAQISQFFAAQLACKAARVPVEVHCLDHPANDEFIALAATRSKENLEVMLAVFPALKLIENVIRKGTEALGTYKALGVP